MVRVRLQGVSKSFGLVKAVDNVSFTVNEGELFFLLGPSGCGKTTTLRVIAGFYKPDAGKVFFDERLINDVPPHKRNIGMVFQNYALWPHMTVYDNVVYGLKAHGVPIGECVKRAREALSMVQMGGYVDRYPGQLSGGQQQRVALARALVLNPGVLLLDEPLSNLDAKLRLEMRGEIKKIQREYRITSIYVTHDQEEALSMADRLAVMNEGRIEQLGTPREIYNDPADSFIAGFIGETNFFNASMVGTDPHAGLVLLETDLGGKAAVQAAPQAFAQDGKVVCSVRPEHVALLNSPDQADLNVFKATIERLSYYGALEHYVLQVGGSLEVKATAFTAGEHKRKEGDEVYFTFRPENVKVFPR